MILIYKTQHCPYCKMVAQLCDKMGFAYEFVPLDDDPKLRQKLVDITGAMTVPITMDGTTYVVGWNPSKLIKLIKEQ